MDLRSFLSQERGRASSLARGVGVSPVTVHQWAAGKQVPAARCPQIERATEGVVTCEELRPDLADHWSYLRGAHRADEVSSGEKAA